MNLTDTYDGSSAPFEGDQTLQWSSLPAGAKVIKATLTLKAVAPPNSTLFTETISFPGSPGDWGTTKVTGTFTSSNTDFAYVEIDFHKRRELISVSQSGLTGASLQIDVGGMYVEINSSGAIKSPGDGPFSLPSTGELPGLTVSKFRLITPPSATPPGPADVTRVAVRSVPTNLAVKLGKLPPFWPRPGDMTDQDTSPDFSALLQTLLASALAVNGFYDVPLVLHSDSIARLQATLNVEYLQLASVLPDGVKEVVLPFDFGSIPKTDPNTLSVKLPANAKISTEATTARVVGSFAETRVIYGPTGDVASSASVAVTPNDSQAQSIVLASAASVSSLDLLIAPQAPGVNLAIDLRADFDGKPDAISLFGSPVQPSFTSQPNSQPAWVNVPFPQPFQFQAAKRYWLVLQSLQSTAAWTVQTATAGMPAMQHTQDGGLSWRETPASPNATPPAALLRLRQVPSTFQVPIDLQVGSGPQAQRIKLDRFQPLGRIDFNLGIPEVSQGFDSLLAKTAPPVCSEVESLANGNFEQWVTVGSDPGQPVPVSGVSASVGAITVSPDGNSVYVGASDTQTRHGLLLTLDAACDRRSAPVIFWPSGDLPQKMLLHPDGTRILILDASGSITVADLVKSVVATVPLGRSTVTDLAFSPNGSILYVLAQDHLRGGGILYTLSLDQFELALSAGRPLSPLNAAGPSLSGQVTFLVVGQQQLYVAANDIDSHTPGAVYFIDAQTVAIQGDPFPVGDKTSCIAITPDGGQLLVGSALGKSLTLINTEHRTTTTFSLTDGTTPPNALTPQAIAVSPDGLRAYIAATAPTGKKSGIAVIDMARKTGTSTISVDGPPSSVAITPQGDQLYVGSSVAPAGSATPVGGSAPTLWSILIGSRTPADWFVTSGQVHVGCCPRFSGAHIIAALGDASGSGSQVSQNQDSVVQPSALSQVAPISAGCSYEFSFKGLTNDPDGIAEILWRGQDCKSSRTDHLPIAQLAVLPEKAVLADSLSSAASAPVQNRQTSLALVMTRGRFRAPDGANAAEVRFVVPSGAAAIATASLRGAADAVTNGNLQSQEQGVPDQWQVSPAGSRNFLVIPSALETILRNNGPSTTSLVQAAQVTPGEDYTLQFDGSKVAGAAANPAVELHWLKDDGSDAATEITEEIQSASFESHPIAGKVPPGAVKLEIHLTLPSQTALAVRQVSLRFPQSMSVPVSFVAQSPGELRISGGQVGYDTIPASPPPVPATGLCPPTPPGQQPGQQAPTSCYCSCCQSETQMTKAKPAMTPAGRPMVVGICADCHNQVVRGGGQPTLASQPLPVRAASPEVQPVPGVAPAAQSPVVPLLSDIVGIGKARAQQLSHAGVKTIAQLAAADAHFVAEVLTGVSVKNAAILIEHAQKLQMKHS